MIRTLGHDLFYDDCSHLCTMVCLFTSLFGLALMALPLLMGIDVLAQTIDITNTAP